MRQTTSDGFPLHGGVQFAIEITMVSPPHRGGTKGESSLSQSQQGTAGELSGWTMVCRNVPILVRAGECQGEGLSRRISSRSKHARGTNVGPVFSVAKSSVLSLLDQAPTGSDGQTPLVHEVIRECRFS